MPPWSLIAWTMRLLIRPESTISTTSTVAASLTRLPSTKVEGMSRRFSISLIIGPPPCTTTGLTLHCFISTTSRAKSARAASLPMAWPPSLMTMVAPS